MDAHKSYLFTRLILILMIGVGTVAFASAAPPVALDDLYHATVDDNLSVDEPGVLSNDSDPDGDSLTAVLIDSSQASGQLFLAADGSFEYEPAPSFIGTDTFTYLANDGSADSNEATITFMVTGTLDVTTYTNQTTFLNDLASAGYTALYEGFEDEAVWGEVRTTIVGGQHTAPSILSQGVTWTANNPEGEVTTGEGAVRSGQWGFFTLPHGSFATGENCQVPLNCGDGWRGVGGGRMVAIGGWVETNTPFAGIAMFLDGNMNAPIDFNVTLGTNQQFIGLIAPSGFDQFEFRETEGVSEDQKFIFSDDFYFAFVTDLFLRSSKIQMALLSSGANVGGRITVVDQDSVAISGVAVSAEWALPDGTIVPVSGVTNRRGRVQWRISASIPGEYVLSVQEVSKSGYVFLGGVLSQILIVPASPTSVDTTDSFEG